jgi:lysylphosphatidylglycerol synthase-like protein
MAEAGPVEEGAEQAPDRFGEGGGGRGATLRRIFPFALALVLVGWVLSRVDWHAFLVQLRAVHYPSYLAFMAAFIVALLAADTVATVYVFRAAVARVRFRELFVVRGASYLPSLLNHHVGQAWLTYFVSRAYDVPLARVAAGTLGVYVTWGGCILLLGAASLGSAGLPIAWTLLPLGLGLAYLVLLAVKPAPLARSRLLGPLFELGVRGHVTAMVLRIPHIVVLFAGAWVPLWFFGVRVPFVAALTYVPILMVAVTLPLTPLGFGTRDALAAAFFEPYAAGSHEERLAAIAASTTTTAVTIMVLDVIVGLALARAAARLLPAKH